MEVLLVVIEFFVERKILMGKKRWIYCCKVCEDDGYSVSEVQSRIICGDNENRAGQGRTGQGERLGD